MIFLYFNLSADPIFFRVARRRKPAKKRREKGSLDSSGSQHNSISSEHAELESSLAAAAAAAADYVDLLNCTVIHVDSESETSRRGSERLEGDEDADEGLLRLPKMADTSMATVGKPLRDVMDRLNGGLDGEDCWEHLGGDEEEEKSDEVFSRLPQPPAQPPFRKDSSGEPPDRAASDATPTPTPASPDFLQTSPPPADLCCFAPFSPDAAPSGGGQHDAAEPGQPEAPAGGAEGEGEAKAAAAAAGQRSEVNNGEVHEDEGQEVDTGVEEVKEEQLSPSEVPHTAEFK